MSEPWCIINHIHTDYSFSPYSPTAAVYFAKESGLSSAGIVDHDSVAGAREFMRAGGLLGLPTTVGVELRVSMAGSAFEGMRTNHPDQIGISYFALHGIPENKIEATDGFLWRLRRVRKSRIERMTGKLNDLIKHKDIYLDFKNDVLPLSRYSEGGGLTERHLLLALARALIKACGRGAGLTALLKRLGIYINEKQEKLLADTEYYFYDYDLLGILKGAFMEQIYIDATDECPKLRDVVAFAEEIGAVLCYAYLGDVVASVTGDKKPQKFEDDYIEELFKFLKDSRVNAITYMLTRNTAAQLKTVKALCKKYDMLEVCGEDINSPRQSFVCENLKLGEHTALINSTRMLIEKTNSTVRG